MVTLSEGQELAKSLGVPFFESSAKTRINVEECFLECVRQIRQRRIKEGTETAPAPASAGGKDDKPAKRRGGCIIL